MRTLVNDMLAAMKRAEALGKPVVEQRLHPDDYAALREQARIYVVAEDGPLTHFNGVKIIVDESAPRLPRRASRTPQPADAEGAGPTT